MTDSPFGYAFHIREGDRHSTFVFDTPEQGYQFLHHHLNADCLAVTPAHRPADLHEYASNGDVL